MDVTSFREQLITILMSADPATGLDLLSRAAYTPEYLPELPALHLEEHPGHRHKDVYLHTLQVVRNVVDLETTPDLTLRLAALMHDTGKPATRTLIKGGASFYGHDTVGARLTKQRLTTLGFDKAFTSDVAQLVRLHLRAFNYHEVSWTESATRRFMTDAEPNLSRLLILIQADATTKNAKRKATLDASMQTLKKSIAEVQRLDAEKALRPALTGDEVMAHFNLTPGPKVGKVLSHLLALKKQGVELTYEEALEEAAHILEQS